MTFVQRWQALSVAPHRLMFFCGSVALILSVLWWLVLLIGLYFNTSLLPPLVFPAAWIHAFSMGYGLYGFFIFGFLMTTFPRWMNQPALTRTEYIPASIALFSGYLLILVGSITHAWALAVGLLAILAGWGWALLALAKVFIRTSHRVNHGWLCLGALALGFVGVFSFTVAHLFNRYELVVLGVQGAIWLYLLPIYIAVCHRMIPFFSSNIAKNYVLHRPDWALYVLVLGAALRFVLDTAGFNRWLWLIDIPLLGTATYLFVLWQPQKCLKPFILSSLHIGFFWLPVSLLLFTAQDAWFALSGQLIMPKAPLHALTIGFFGSMLVAMATRVTMGHSGNPLVMDRVTWLLFFGVQIAAVTRVLAELPMGSFLFYKVFIIVSAVAWLGFLAPWVIKYAPIYLKPRVDGQPG
jgi:uncharacterized protein involved in response to NO